MIGSADFPESSLLSEIYAEALEAKSIAVTMVCNFASRAVYYPAVLSGQLTIVPEYNGALLTTMVDPSSAAVTTGQVDATLKEKLPPGLAILNPAPAQDKDSVTVTQATAAKYHLVSIADLRRIAKDLVIGGPPEFEGRVQGLVGLRRNYGLIFKSFRPLDDSGPTTRGARGAKVRGRAVGKHRVGGEQAGRAPARPVRPAKAKLAI